MITKVSGDILLTEAQAIAHGVAPADHFESGLALELREQWPSMVKDFRHYCHGTHTKTGDAWLWAGPAENGNHGKIIINLMTQEAAENTRGNHPGPASASSVSHALKALRKIIEKEGIQSIALPRLATGVGQMDWAEVNSLIEQHLGDLNIPVLVYETYVKGKKAQENLSAAA
jgi:O-acetyl-ADP-ribose deacetylase (regulator of RNase III)